MAEQRRLGSLSAASALDAALHAVPARAWERAHAVWRPSRPN